MFDTRPPESYCSLYESQTECFGEIQRKQVTKQEYKKNPNCCIIKCKSTINNQVVIKHYQDPTLRFLHKLLSSRSKARASFCKNIDPERHSKDTYSKKMLVCACVFIF